MKKYLQTHKIFAVSLVFLILLTLTFCFIIDSELFAPGKEADSSEPVQVQGIIPKPVEYTANSGAFTLTDSAAIYADGVSSEETEEIRKIGEYLAGKLRPSTGYPLSVRKEAGPDNGSILLTTTGGDAGLGREGYQLDVTPENITLRAYTPEGLFRGVQTLRQLLPAQIESSSIIPGAAWSIACMSITDYPVYEWRGMMLDAARHFISVNNVKRTIDLIAEYKINRLHLHLSNDQGWRIEIKARPLLTEIGGSTEVGGGKGGFYTQEEYAQIVDYARERYITVIPEIDMPGHCNAALASYGELNPDGVKKELYTGTEVGFSSLMCRSEITYEFIEDVIRELAALTPGEYIHVGGDEASQTSPEDYNYFIGRVNEIVASHGKTAIGWGPYDSAEGTGSDEILQSWNGNASYAVDKNMKVILSPSGKAYLDMKYYADSPLGLEWAGYINTRTAYDWDPADYMKADLIIGVEGPLWSETIKTMEDIEYLAFPRILGLAEIGWTPTGNRSWGEYEQRLKAHGARMEYLGINYFKDPAVKWE